MKHIAIYVRVSTDLQDTISQIDAIETWLRHLPPEKRPETRRIFQDQGRSGSDDKRPGFLTMLEAARNGEIDTVLAFSLDRISRSATTALRTILDLDALGVAFVATSQPILNLGHENPFRRTMLAAFAEIAEIERTITITRIKAGLEAARKRGVRLGQVPLSPDKRRKILELREYGFTQQTIAHQLGLGRATVCRVLKSEGLTGSRKAEESFC